MLTETLIALIFLVLLATGLYYKKKEKKEWLKEARYDESGDWLDKRAGERGTFGSVDREMDQARKAIARETKVYELAQLLREHSGAQTNQNNPFFKDKAVEITVLVEKWLKGERPGAATSPVPGDDGAAALKKQILRVLFRQYPNLLDLDVEEIRQLDEYVGKAIERV